MKGAGNAQPRAAHPSDELLSEILHGLSQPLTTMECGLEIALRQDKTVAQLQQRMGALLEAARVLHKRLLEVRALQEAGTAGERTEAVAVGELLQQLREDFQPIAREAKITMSVRATRDLAQGNAAHLRNGFFHLLEFLACRCPAGGQVRMASVREGGNGLTVRFRIVRRKEGGSTEPIPRARDGDFGLRIARRTFEAAGGDLELREYNGGGVAGQVRLRSAMPPAGDD